MLAPSSRDCVSYVHERSFLLLHLAALGGFGTGFTGIERVSVKVGWGRKKFYVQKKKTSYLL